MAPSPASRLLVVVQSSNQRHHYTDACSREVLDGLADDRSGLSVPGVVLERADVLHASACGPPWSLFGAVDRFALLIAALPLRSAIVWVGPPLLLSLAMLGATPTMSVGRLNPAQEVGDPIVAGPSGETGLWCRRRPGRLRRAPRGRSRENADGRAIDLAQLPAAQRASPGSGYPPPSAANRASESSTSARTSAR